MRNRLPRLGLATVVVVSLLMVQAGQALATPPTSAPTIVSPVDGSSVGNANPTLSWKAVGNAVRYRVQISTSLSFASTIYSADVYALQATPPTLLPFSTLYWRVAGEDDGNVLGPWSAASFTKSISSAPVALTPTNGQTLTFPTNPVVFSWQPVPGAVSYTLQVGNSSDFIGAQQFGTYNTSYTLTDTQSFTKSDGSTPQSWWWQVQANYVNASVTQWSTPRSYQIVWPATPQLESPANGAVGVVDTVFSWDPVPGAARYDIQVSPNGDWQNNKVIDQPGLVSTRFAPDQTLNNSSYYWRVRARAAGNATNYGQWSAPFLFTRSWSPRPVTVSPHWSGGLADPPTVGNLEFSWTPAAASGAGWVDHASHYEIQIGTDSNFSNGTYWVCTTDQTTYTPYAGIRGGGEPGGCSMGPSLEIGTVYYWRVRAIDGPAGVYGLWDSTSSSDTQRFIYLPGLPDLSCGPASGTHVQTPVLCWSAVSGAEQYRVTIERHDGTPADQIVTYGLSYTTMQTLSPADGPFTWNVETIDSQGHLGPTRASWPSFYLDAPTTVTSLSLLTPLNLAHTLRMPSMTWQPYTGATYYEVLYGVTPGIFNSTPLSGSTHLPFAGFTYTGVPLAPGRYYWEVQAFDVGNALLATSSMRSFYVGTTGTGGDWIIPWNNYLRPECQAQTDPRISRCTPLLGQTQELTWTPDPNAATYVVYVAKDVNFTNIYRIYQTGQTSLTPRESWLDSQAGESYYWFVRPCVDWAQAHCGPGPDTNAGLNDSSAYRKSSPATNGLTTTTAANPPVRASTIPQQVTFNWADYMTTSQASTYPVAGVNSTRVTQEAKWYAIQVSTTSDFGNIIDSRTVDQTQYTPWSSTYPEGPLYWRVQALDGSDNPLTMSATGTVTKASAPITLASPANTATVSGVPYFTWVPQNWAARYTIEVYRNGDLNFSGANRLFSVTTPMPAWSPTANMPAGVYSWRVQRLDANDRPGPWSTGRTFTLHPSPPALNTPADLARLNGANLYFTWLGVQGADSYQFQSSAVADFSSLVENQTTVMTAWSPLGQYNPGVYFWRVELLDASNNVLSTSSSRSFSVGTMPGAPTGATATAGNTTATVSWTAPTSSGSAPISGYIVTSKPGGKTCTTTGATQCTVGGLTNGTAYTFAVQAITGFGTGPASADSNAVVPSSATALVVSAGLRQTSHVPFNVTVTARDGLGAIQTGYRGKVRFASTDPLAVLPTDYTFAAADNGSHIFSVTLKTAGTWSVTATDTANSSIKGTQSGIVVQANPTAGATYHTLPPVRVLDSRPGVGHIGPGLFHSKVKQTFSVATLASGVPSSAVAVTGNVTIVGQSHGGYVTVAPSLTSGVQPPTSTINFPLGDTRANGITVPLAPGGKLDAMYWGSKTTDTVNVIFDVTGYFG